MTQAPPVTIRAGRAGDAGALARLVAVTVRFSNAYEYTDAGRTQIARLYGAASLGRSLAGGRVRVAEDARGIAGFVTTARRERAISVEALFVHPDAQGRGIGAALLEAGVAAAAPDEGAEPPRVTVLSSLTAEGFYARAGFERLRTVRRPYGAAILMSRS
ncbi:MAG: GNAT family N-acetyltransferase [Pseudomonadota bacterium]